MQEKTVTTVQNRQGFSTKVQQKNYFNDERVLKITENIIKHCVDIDQFKLRFSKRFELLKSLGVNDFEKDSRSSILKTLKTKYSAPNYQALHHKICKKYPAIRACQSASVREC